MFERAFQGMVRLAGVFLMACSCSMDAILAADHIVLPFLVKQHAALKTKTIRRGAYFHRQVALTGNTFTLDIQRCFTRVCFKEFCQGFNVQHWHSLNIVCPQVAPAMSSGKFF